MKREYWPITICIGIIFFFCASIFVRFGVRQVLIKRLNMDNAIIRAVFFDDEALLGRDIAADGIGQSTEKVIDWEKQYPFPAKAVNKDVIELKSTSFGERCRAFGKRISRKVESAEKKIMEWTTTHLVGYNMFVSIGQFFDNSLVRFLPVQNVKDIIFMNNGYLTYKENKLTSGEIEEITESVSGLHKFLEAENIGFLYVNAGSKVNPIDKQFSAKVAELETTNERGDMLQAALRVRGVPFMDMREELHADKLDWYDSYYKYDHHWKTETGLWAAGKIAKKLNEEYGFSYDLKYFSKDSYDLITYEACFVGGQGREVGLGRIMPEEYTRILPRFDTVFDIEIPTRNLHRRGAYNGTLFDDEHFERCLKYEGDDYIRKPDTYHSTMWRNDALGIIKNLKDCNNDKRVLMIQDSFSWYLTTYLACDTREVHLIYPSGFTGSIREYIRKTRPDMVVVVLCERNIEPINWLSHDSKHDFR